MVKKVVIVGLGYVGLTMAAHLTEKGMKIIGVDVDVKKLEYISHNGLPIFEPNIKGKIERALNSKLLTLTSEYLNTPKDSDITFITVGTPDLPNGTINLDQIKLASENIGCALKNRKYHLIVIRSTITPGTSEKIIKPILEKKSGKSCGIDFGLCMNPEFVSEGNALQDMQKPNRIIIGEYDQRSGRTLEDFYRNIYLEDIPEIIKTNLVNAEMIKYANNAFLATKISFINSIANLCEKIPECDVGVVSKAMGLDPRISPFFLKAGLGWGGSCLPKDLKAFLSFSRDLGIDLPMIDSALKVNESQPMKAVEKAKKALGNLKGKCISILGLSFKTNTDDMREAVSVRIIANLLNEGALIRAYDPVANKNAKKIFGKKIFIANSAKECIDSSDCCIIVTEWDEFKKLRPTDFKTNMKRSLIIDGRRLYDPKEFSSIEYITIGLGET